MRHQNLDMRPENLLDVINQYESANMPELHFDPQNYICCSASIMLLTGKILFDQEGGEQKHFRAVRKHCLPWDDAANSLAIREAGGELINWSGEIYMPDMFYTGVIAAPSLRDCLLLRETLVSVVKE